MRSGSAVQVCWIRVLPSSPQVLPMSLWAVSSTRRIPASQHYDEATAFPNATKKLSKAA
jgi:hypothetical protein